MPNSKNKKTEKNSGSANKSQNVKKITITNNKLNVDNGSQEAKAQKQKNQMVPAQPSQHSSAMAEISKVCPSCGSTDLIYDTERGELVCNNCGLVIEENITDTGPEWRAFDSDQRNSRARTGAPMKYTRPNKGLVTEIDLYNKDIRGVRIPSKRQAQLYRMRKWHKRASIASSSERNYLIALPELNRVSSYLGLPENINNKELKNFIKKLGIKTGVVKRVLGNEI